MFYSCAVKIHGVSIKYFLSKLCNMSISCGLNFPQINRILWRRKPFSDGIDSKLARVLSTFDLTALGIGSTLGVGVYVIAGNVARNYAGPAVVLSFLIAGIASIFAGLCYAEFGARVPKAGSAYIYSYVTIGEFIAFLIGWNLILEYAIGSASVAKGLSTYLDSLFDNCMAKYLREHLPITVEGFGEFPDVFAFFVTISFALALACGAKESSTVNNIFTGINLFVIGIVITIGLFLISPNNWNLSIDEIPSKSFGQGGFMPYGYSGVIRGAAVCFYGFIGFDCIATAGEEARNPRKAIPIAIIASLTIIFLAYFGISIVLTMMLPYYAQDEDAPLPYAFRVHNVKFITQIITIGGVFGLFASLMGSMFSLPRIVFAMSSDGLLFECLGSINSRFRTPFVGTIFSGFLTAILAAIFDLNQLVSMMSIGTLMAFTMVACCVIILRYRRSMEDNMEGAALLQPYDCKSVQQPCGTALVILCVCIYCVGSFITSGFIAKLDSSIDSWNFTDFAAIFIGFILLYMCLFIISLQPTSKCDSFFNVPLVPWLPGISISINIYLMLMLDNMTWVRFGIWIVFGFIIYAKYSVQHSRLRGKS